VSFDLIVVWILCGLLGAGFYVAAGKELTKRRDKSDRRILLVGMFFVALVLGPLGIAASFLDMWRKKTWYGWTLW
jgi:nitric oxide reductase large subunit